LSILLIALGKRVLSTSVETCIFYFFLTVVWIFRAMLASFIEPWTLNPIPAAAIGQRIASDTLALLMVIMSGILLRKMKAEKRLNSNKSV